jgi:hypothetical protein
LRNQPQANPFGYSEGDGNRVRHFEHEAKVARAEAAFLEGVIESAPRIAVTFADTMFQDHWLVLEHCGLDSGYPTVVVAL